MKPVINSLNQLFSADDKVSFLAALNTGLGLTSACELLLLSPKDVSEYIQKDKSLYQECIAAVQFSARALLVISNTYLTDEKYDQWKTNNSVIREFIPTLVFWESYKQRDAVSAEDITVALNLYKTVPELATACGFTRRELLEFIVSNEQLCLYFTEKNLF